MCREKLLCPTPKASQRSPVAKYCNEWITAEKSKPGYVTLEPAATESCSHSASGETFGSPHVSRKGKNGFLVRKFIIEFRGVYKGTLLGVKLLMEI